MKTELIRKTWPKIRPVFVRGEKFYQVDARRQGTNGKRETFSLRTDAEKRAAEIEKDFAGNGSQGLAMPAELRSQAFTAQKILAPYGKTIVQAAEFYREHLEQRQQAQESALVSVLAGKWYEDKASGKTKALREETLRGIKQGAERIKEAFGTLRIHDVSPAHVLDYLDKQKVSLQTKYNLNSIFSQFFNWCANREYIPKNPCDKIEITVNGKDVEIFTPSQAQKLLDVCQEQFPDYTLYHAISLFGGLRPEECQHLQWENVDLEERTIYVTAETSKIKESRPVHIEDNLLAWLKLLKPEKAKGHITPQTNFIKYNLQIHIAAGYRGTLVTYEKGKTIRTIANPKAATWPQDVMRHSYGSYWLSKHANRAQLAENMGNSLQIIKKHYKRVVSKSDTAAYWAILPAGTAEQAKRDAEAAKQAFPV